MKFNKKNFILFFVFILPIKFLFSFSGQSVNSWIWVSSSPANALNGVGICSTSDSIYIFRGGSVSFWKYSPLDDSWVWLSSCPDNVGVGSDLVWDGGDFIYATRGNFTNEFWQYHISGDSWSIKKNLDVEVSSGCSLVFTADNFIFATQGDGTGFYLYDINQDLWFSTTPILHPIGSGSEMAWDGNNQIFMERGGPSSGNMFYIYNLLTKEWIEVGTSSRAPGNPGIGGSLVFNGGDQLFRLRGANSNDFDRYCLTHSSWNCTEDNLPYSKPQKLPINIGSARGHRLAVLGDYIFCFGGSGFNGSGTPTMLRYRWRDVDPPGKITDFVAQAGSNAGEIILSWSSPGNDGSYGNLPEGSLFYIQYSSFEDVEFSTFTQPPLKGYHIYLPTGPVTTSEKQVYTITGLMYGVTYYFRIWSFDNALNCSVVSNGATTWAQYLSSVENFRGVALSSGSIKWMWDIKEDATYYLIFDKDDQLIANTEDNSYVEVNLSSNTKYERYIVAGNQYGFSYPSNLISVYTLAYPVEFLISTSTLAGIKLSWNLTGAKKYLIARSTSNFDIYWSTVSILEGNIDNYFDNDVLGNTTYFYRVYVYNEENVLNYNFLVETSTLTYPSQPTGFDKLNVFFTSITWVWNKVSCDGYRIYQTTSPTTLVAEILSQDTTSYTETNLEINKQYSRFVRAFNIVGESFDSNNATFYTLSLPVSNLEVYHLKSNEVGLIWNSNGNPNYTRYEVSYSTDNFVMNFSTPITLYNNYTSTSVMIKNLKSNTTYYFRVRSFNNDNLPSNFSNYVSVKTEKSKVLISQFATQGLSSSRDEFVELYNATDEDLDISGFSLYYWNGSNWIKVISIPINAKIKAYSFYLISSSTDYFKTIQPDLYKNYLNLGNGANGYPRALRLLDHNLDILDTVGYEDEGGTDFNLAEGGKTAPSHSLPPNNNKSVIRKKDIKGKYIDTDNNYNDFIVSSIRNPRNSLSSAEIPDYIAPSSISDLVALTTENEAEIKLTWTQPGNDEDIGNFKTATFRIKYATFNFTSFDENDDYNLEFSLDNIDAQSEIEYIVKNLASGTTYYFGVIVRDEFYNWSKWKKDALTNVNNSAWVLDLEPPAPFNFYYQIFNRAIYLSWDHPLESSKNDIEKYLVYLATFSFNSLSLPHVINVSTVIYPSNSLTIENLENGIDYYLTVISVDKEDNGSGYYGKSLVSSSFQLLGPLKTSVRPPTNLKALHYSDKIILSWQHSQDYLSNNFVSYKVYKSTHPNYNFYISTYTIDNFYIDKEDISPLVTYYYYIVSVDDKNLDSLPSEIVFARPDVYPPEFVFVSKINPRDLAKEYTTISLKVVDDRFQKGDKLGKLTSLEGKFRNVSSSSEIDVNFKPAFVEGVSEYIGSAEFDLSTIVIGLQGIEYRFVAKDEVHISSYPADGGWIKVLESKDLPQQKFLTPKNPNLIFGSDVEEVIIKDYNGNELWSKKSNGDNLIIWNSKDKNGKDLESGPYIYKIKTKDGKIKYGVIIIVR